MTPATRSQGTPPALTTATGTDVLPSSADEARRTTAIAALLHRVSGGLNNAAMAFELALVPATGEGEAGSERILRAGLAGVNQAARAVTLVGELAIPGTTEGLNGMSAQLRDIVEVVRGRAALRAVTLRIDDESLQGDGGATTPPLAVASLLDALRALDAVDPGAALSLAMATTQQGPQLRLHKLPPGLAR